jgi:positive regulator of sigma E activity
MPRLITVLVRVCVESLIRSEVRAVVVGASTAFFLALVGLFVGAGLAQFFPPPSLTVFIVPLALNIGLGWMLVREGQRTVGQTLLYGGSIASIALPFILL